jgi:peptide/nickel transport system permease protein
MTSAARPARPDASERAGADPCVVGATDPGRMRARLRRSVRIRLALLVLACFATLGLFADFVAADAPWLAIGPAGVRVFPAIVSPQSYRGLGAAEIAERHARDWALWSLVRSGPETPALVGPNAASSRQHPLGTDALGRDVCARLVHGARYALGFGLGVVLAALLLGGALGAMAGYRGGVWDELLSRPIELVEAFPQVVVVAVARALDPSGSALGLGLAVIAVRWAEMARLVRAEVLRLGNEEYVLAARALGCSRRRLVLRHMLPNAVGPIVVSASFAFASVVLLEVAVSFLGLGVRGSWGVLIADGLTGRAPLGATIGAALALGLLIVAAHLLGDALGELGDARVATTRAVRRRSAPALASARSAPWLRSRLVHGRRRG